MITPKEIDELGSKNRLGECMTILTSTPPEKHSTANLKALYRAFWRWPANQVYTPGALRVIEGELAARSARTQFWANTILSLTAIVVAILAIIFS